MRDFSGEARSLADDGDVVQPESLLHPLADELMQIAARLRDAAAGSIEAAPDQDARVPPKLASSRLALARRSYALRRKRSAIFGNAEIFGEPAWDILLDLFIAQGEGKSVSVSSACIGSASPPTTGLRWLGILADHGFIEREADPADLRRVMVRLSAKEMAAMERFFDEVKDGA